MRFYFNLPFSLLFPFKPRVDSTNVLNLETPPLFHEGVSSRRSVCSRFLHSFSCWSRVVCCVWRLFANSLCCHRAVRVDVCCAVCVRSFARSLPLNHINKPVSPRDSHPNIFTFVRVFSIRIVWVIVRFCGFKSIAMCCLIFVLQCCAIRI